MSKKFVHIDNRLPVSLEYHDRRDRENNKRAWQEATKDLPDDAFGESVMTEWDKYGTLDIKETHIFKTTSVD